MKTVAFFFITLCLLIPAKQSAWGAAGRLIPKYVNFTSSFKVHGLYTDRKTDSEHSSSKANTLKLQEHIVLNGYGYIYSPLFISMKTSAALGLKQNRFKRSNNNVSTSSSRRADATNFSHMFKILPNHPYNFELYGSRSTPMSVSGQDSGVYYNYGARALYDKRPWATHLIYQKNEAHADTVSTSDSLSADIKFFDNVRNLAIFSSYGHNTAESGITSVTGDSYALTLSKGFRFVSFSSGYRYSKTTQEIDYFLQPASLYYDSTSWNGSIGLALPYNFKTTLSYKARENSFHYDDQGSSTKSEQYTLNTNHQLYASLTTAFIADYRVSTSSGGETSQENYLLNSNYRKMIPWGSILCSLTGSTAFYESQGTPKALLEKYEADSFGQFTLHFTRIDPETIVIHLVDSNDSLIHLEKGVHYEVAPDPQDPEKHLIFIRPETVDDPRLVQPPQGREDYKYQVSYSFLSGDYRTNSTNWGGSLQMPLFDRLITPHYLYNQYKQKLVSGYFAGNMGEGHSHSLGLGAQYKPFKGDVTHVWTESNTKSQKRLQAYVDMHKAITPFTTGIAKLEYQNSTLESKGSAGEDIELSEQIYSAMVQLQALWPQRNLTGSISGNYSFMKSVAETTNMSFFSSLSWHVNNLALSLSASYTDSESTYSGDTVQRNYTVVRFGLSRSLN